MRSRSLILITFLLYSILSSSHITLAKQIELKNVESSFNPNYNVTFTLIDELNVGGASKDIEIIGNIAYVLSNSGLNLYNVTDIEKVLELGHYYSDGYLGHSIAIYNNYVFTAADDLGLKIINVIDPTNPQLVDTITSTRPAAIYIKGNLLFVANWEHDFEIYDISSVPTITEVKRFEGTGFYYAYASEELAFAFANNGSLVILDIIDQEHIEKISTIDDKEISCIAIEGNYWYAGGSNGIKIFNSTNLSEPTFISHINNTEQSHITNLAIQEGFLYASDYYQGFRIFKILDDFLLEEIGIHEAGGSPLGFYIKGDISFVASQIRGIQIIGIKIIELDIEKTPFFEIEIILSGILALGLYSYKKREK